jgi:hypothetical protein
MSHRTAAAKHTPEKQPAELMSEEPKIHIGKQAPKEQPTISRILIALDHRSSRRRQAILKNAEQG